MLHKPAPLSGPLCRTAHKTVINSVHVIRQITDTSCRVPVLSYDLDSGGAGQSLWIGEAVLYHCSHPSSIALTELWLERRGDRPFPLRKDLDVLDLRAWLGSLAIYDYSAEKDNYFCRLFGETIRRAVGTDMTRRWMSDYPDDLYQRIRGQYDMARQQRVPLLTRFISSAMIVGEFQNNRFPAEKLILPLSRTGDAVDCFLTYSIAL